jgi:hypothetical protein
MRRFEEIAQVGKGRASGGLYTPQRPRRRPVVRWPKPFARFRFEEPQCLVRTVFDFVATTNACASLLTKTLDVVRSNPCGPLSRNYACVSLGNVATRSLAKTRRRSPTNPPRTPGPSIDLPASGALAAMDNVGGDRSLSSATRDQRMRNFSARSKGTSPNPSMARKVAARSLRGRHRRGNRCDARSRSVRRRSSAQSVSPRTIGGWVSRDERGLIIAPYLLNRRIWF